MKKTLHLPVFIGIAILFVSTLNVSAQTTETFETEANNSTSFTDNGQVFNITSQARGPFDIQTAFPGFGWNGSSSDNRFIDNDGYATAGFPVGLTISSAGSVPFRINSMWLYLSDHNANVNVTGSLTIVGKKSGVIKFTATASSGFNQNAGISNGFSLINFTTFGGANNTGFAIDELVITTTNNFNYLALDAFTWTAIAPVTATQSQVNITCNGSCNGSASVIASGGNTPYTYSWAPSGGTAATASSLCAGSYTCTITDNNAISITKTFTIAQPTAPVSGTTVVTNVSCFGGSNGAINLTPSGGTGPYTFLWLPSGPTTEDRTGLVAGAYNVQITDVNGCTGTVIGITVTQPSQLSGTTVVTNVSCNGGTNGAINLTASGGTGPYTFNWGGGITTEDRTGLAAATYAVIITDANGCTKNVTGISVTQPAAAVSGTTVVTNVSCNGGTNGVIDLTPAGGTGPYTYNWGGGVTSQDRISLAAGTYSVIITDQNGCTGTVSGITITQPSQVAGTTVVTNVSCNGGTNGTINLTASGGSGPYTFNWGGGITTEDRTGLAAATYAVIITDANGCTKTVTGIAVTQPASAVSGTTVVTNVSCNGGTNGVIDLTPAGGTGPYTYNWGGGVTSQDRISLAAGTYSVIITDQNGCTGTVSGITITQPSQVSGTTVVTNVSCFGGSNGTINLTASGGSGPYTFNWGGGITTEDRTGLAAATYAVIITDANGCTKTVTGIAVTQPASAVSGTTVVTNVSCNGGTNGVIDLTPAGGTGPYTYNWGGGVTSQDRISLVAGTYSVIITDQNGCTGTVSGITITQPSQVSGTTVVTNVSCFGGSNGTINLTASGGSGPYTFNWGGGITTEDRTGLAAATYAVIITDANGCTKTVTGIAVTQPASAVSGTTVVTNVSCNGGTNGVIDLTPAGGTGPYTYNWGGGVTSQDRISLAAGTYSVIITDQNGCTGTVSGLTVTQPAQVSGTTVVTNVSCFGGSNGAINLTASGGTGPYTFNWLPSGPATEDRTGLIAGTYTVQITDANGCTVTNDYTITEPPAITADTSQINVSCNGGNNGSATVTASGGTGDYTYAWAPSGGTAATASGLAAGSYTCTITDENSCSISKAFTITELAVITADTSQINVSCNGGNNGSATVTASGGTGNYTYAWAPSGGTAATASGLAAGSYTCTITDENSCSISKAFTITELAVITADTSQINVSCNGGNNGSATVTASGGTGNYTYAWAPSGGTAATASGLAAGSYTCTITDENSCSITKAFTITELAAISADTSQINVSCNGGNNGSATVTASGGTGNYTYAWAPSGGTAATASGLAAGSYTCTITDENSCSVTKAFTITELAAITADTSQINVSCNGGSNGSATVTASGGTGIYTYAWAPSGGTAATASGLAAGSYTCTITDENSCSITKAFTITELAAITADTSQINVSCNGGNNGSATVTASGGTGNYTYAWAPSGGTAATASGLAAGSYTCTITDENSCSITKTVTITEPSAITAATSQTNVSCNGGSSGSATVTPSGGAGGYNYSWAPSGGTGATASDLAAGSYTCTITDENSCSITKTFIITQTSAVTATASKTNVSCTGASTGSASVTASGGAGGYTYSWAPSGGTGATASDLAAGSYTCTITDVNSCSIAKTVSITEPSSTPGSNNYSLPTSDQTVVNAANDTNFVSGTCEVVSAVMASGTSPVSGSVTNNVWVEDTVPTDNGLPYVQRHYEITPANNPSSSTGTVTLYFTQDEFDNFNAHASSTLNLPANPTDNNGKANLRIGKYTGVSGDGSGVPSSYSGTAMVIDPDDDHIVWNAVSNTWEVTFEVNGFSGFIIQTNVSVLPVSWISFTIKKQGQAVILKWSTAADQNIKSFTVQHSNNGINWNSAAIVPATGNNSLNNYSYTDNNTVIGYNYYRIVQTDFNGKISYSEMRVLELSGDVTTFTIPGNIITNGVLHIQVYQPTAFSLYEMSGKRLWVKQFAAGPQSVNVSRYAKGIYLLRTKGRTQKILLQ